MAHVKGPEGQVEPAAAVREYPWAVSVMRVLDRLLGALPSFLRQLVAVLRGHRAWPGLPGSYVLGEASGAVAVCTLSDKALMVPLAALPGVAIAGRIFTANLGVEKLVRNVTANPRLRFLVLCGKDSPLFRPGQTLKALSDNGLGPDRRIIGAEGHMPVLSASMVPHVALFREQIAVIDCRGETDLGVLGERLRELRERNAGALAPRKSIGRDDCASMRVIRPGGQREPLAYDPKGYFVIQVDADKREIVLQHFLPDNTPAHVMRGRSGEGMLLGLLREGLVSQLSHAGYLGAELAKAETALRLGATYEQDRGLVRSEP
jgi:tetrahydromethanopterin S-methyltransferase subunit A